MPLRTNSHGTNSDGAVLIDKPAGLSSAAVVARVKRRLRVKRVGHSGTLDPDATGLLVILCGNATRLQSVFLESEKTYEGTIRLGVRTSTDDLAGEVLEEDRLLRFRNEKSDEEWLAEVRAHFSGMTMQRPPAVSAIRVGGKRSYALARKGAAVELDERNVWMEFLELSFEAQNTLKYRVRCSKGTYVRSLARDIGGLLGTCAALESIRRLESSPFSISDSIGLEAFEQLERPEDCLLSMEQLVAQLPSFELSADDCRLLQQGVQAPLSKLGGETRPLAAVFEQGGRLQGLIEAGAPGAWKIRCMFANN